MKEILELYAGRGEPAAVLAAAEKAREHMTQAAGPFRMDRSMGKVAVMHAKLRGWAVAEVTSSTFLDPSGMLGF